MDLPAGATTHSSAALVLPDAITELDLALPDASFLLNDIGDVPFTSTAHTSRKQDITLNEDILLDDSIEQARKQDDGFEFGDDVLQWEDLNLDIGDDDAGPIIPSTDKPSEEPEVGRDLMPDMTMRSSIAPDLGFDDDATMLGADKQKQAADNKDAPEDVTNLGGEFDDTVVGGPDISELQMDEPMLDAPQMDEPMLDGFRAGRGSESPLSSIRSSVERELGDEASGDKLDTGFLDRALGGSEEVEEQEEHERVKKTRKRRVLVDDVTEINGKQLKIQMTDRSAILKEPIFLPRDPTMLTLMSLHKTGGFATSFFYPKNIHPDLADLLSPDFVQIMAAAKRKRGEEEGAIELREDGEEEPAAKKIQLDLELEEEQQQEHKEFEADATANRTADEILEVPEHRAQSPMRFDDRSFDMTSGNLFSILLMDFG